MNKREKNMENAIIEISSEKLVDRILHIVENINNDTGSIKKEYSETAKQVFLFLNKIGIPFEYIGKLNGNEDDYIEKVSICGITFDMQKIELHSCRNCGNWRCHDPFGTYYMDTCYNSVGKIYWEPKNESESE